MGVRVPRRPSLWLAVFLFIGAACTEEPGGLRGARAAADASEVVRDIFAGRYRNVTEHIDETMKEGLSEESLAAARREYEDLFGTFVSMGAPELLERGSFTVINIPLHMSEREGQARITYDERNQIVGLYLLRLGVPVR